MPSAVESRALLSQASQLVAGGPLKRMTILAARPDTTVVVQADYYSPEEAGTVDSRLPALAHDAYAAQGGADDVIDVQTHSAALGRPTALSSYLNPIEYYASAQRAFENSPRAQLLNVLA
jgi:hypothetical protein